jgi:RHS repeat-associated protein
MATDRRYTGQRWEASVGFYDYGARSYDPALGRFLQADTIVPNPANQQSLNRYSYVLNNPLKYTDPTGHLAEGEYGQGDVKQTLELLRLARLPIIYHLPLDDAQVTQWYGGTNAARGPVGEENNYAGYSQGFHGGLDFGHKPWGTPLYAGVYGRVVGAWPPGQDDAPLFFGRYRVDIRYGNWCIINGHMGEVSVVEGQDVTPRTLIGGVGNQYGDPKKGNIHLHWEFRYAPSGAPNDVNCSHEAFSEIYNPLTFMLPEDYKALTADFDPQAFHVDNPYGSDPLRQTVIHRGGPSLWK